MMATDLESSRVTVVCTTDDPTDSLEQHRKIRAAGKLKTRVYPAWRADKALVVEPADRFNAWVDKLGRSRHFPGLSSF